MEKRRNQSLKKNSKRKASPKKTQCTLCKAKLVTPVIISNSLYRKYSSSQNLYFLQQFANFNPKPQSLSSTAVTEP